MDLLRDEVVKRFEQVLRLSRDTHAKGKNSKMTKRTSKVRSLQRSKLSTWKNWKISKIMRTHPFLRRGKELRLLTKSEICRPGVETELDHSTLDEALSSMAANAIVEIVPSNVQAQGAAAGDGSEAEATHTHDGGAPTPVVQSGNDDIAQLVEERAAAAGISLDAPASEDPDVVAAALASTGIDPTFLAALPDEMRGEVLTQMFQQLASSHPTDVGQEATSSTILSQDFLIALPPALRAEVLQQEATFRARSNMGNAGNDAAQGDNQDSQAVDTGAETLGGSASQGRGPSDTDAATVLATMPRELREEIFLTSAESFLESLPAHMAAEARAVRERVMGRLSRGWRQPPDLGIMQFGELVVPARTFRAEEDQPSERRQPRTSWACNDGIWMRLAPPVDKEPPALCGNSALASLVNLLQLHSSQFGKTLLYHVLAHLCKKASARRRILNLLFDTVEQKRSGQTQTSRTSNLANTGDVTASTSLEVPVQEISVPVDIEYATCAVVVRRALELLTNLCKNESILAESIVMVPEAHTHVPDDDECCSLTFDGFSPVTRLIGLLSEPLFQRSSTHQEQLLLLLATVCGAIPEASVPFSAVVYTGRPALAGELDTGVAPEHAVDNISDIANAVAEPTRTMTHVQPPERDSDADSDSVTDTDGEISASANDRSKAVDRVTVPVQSRVPALRADHVCALTNILLQEGPSDRTHQRATNVLGQFGMLPGNRRLALEALSDCASRLASSVSTAFKSFVTALPPGKVVDSPARASAIQEFSMVASADELKFLRVVKAISVLVKGLPVGDSSVEADSGEKSWLEISRMGYVNCVGDLWSSLDAVLCTVHEQHPANLERNANDSSVSARDSVDALANAVVSTINGGSSSRLGGKAHSLAPILARLSPVIESFFVYHGPACPDGSQEISKDVEKSKPRSEPDSAHLPNSPGHTGTSFDGQKSSLISCERELGTFIERHRIALNAILRVNPQLLDGSFRPALRHAHAIDFDNKKAYFRALIRKRSSEAHAGTIRITVRRDRVFDDSYHQLRSHSAEEMKGRLHVQFNGEEGIDAGGVTREWYVILARQIFDPNYALFCRSAAKAATYQPNKASAINREHLDNFRFVGRIFGKAIYDGQLLDAYFTRAFYKHILGIKPTYHDIEAEDPEYYKSLCWILENDITDIIDETFSTEFEEFGQQHIVDLKPNGRNVQVTEENKEEYVRLVTEVKLTKAISMQIASFKEGFHELIPLEDCRIFNEVELELLTSGLPDIDVADLKANVEYTGYTPGSPQINWFWTAVSRMGQEDLARLVMFVTGTSKVPLEGFSALQGMNGLQKFQIHRASGGKDRLPSAHTCFNQLDLPEYDSCDTLSERLLRAVRETEGFGFA
jgi:E3 ubiquitin-protein ligase HUWE1